MGLNLGDEELGKLIKMMDADGSVGPCVIISMHVCMCVCRDDGHRRIGKSLCYHIYACVYACMYVCMYAEMMDADGSVGPCVIISMHVCMHVCRDDGRRRIGRSLCYHIYACMYVRMYVCMYAEMMDAGALVKSLCYHLYACVCV
jgi:hypothetical protein